MCACTYDERVSSDRTDVIGRRRRATVKDVATEAGVSRGTVSRVLNGQPYVSEEARAAIEAAIAKVGFVPTLIAAG